MDHNTEAQRTVADLREQFPGNFGVGQKPGRRQVIPVQNNVLDCSEDVWRIISLLKDQRTHNAFRAVMTGENPTLEAALKSVSPSDSDHIKKTMQIIATWLAASSFALVATTGIAFAILAKQGIDQAMIKMLTALFEATKAQLIGGAVGGLVAILVIVAAAYLIKQHLELKAVKSEIISLFQKPTERASGDDAAPVLQ